MLASTANMVEASCVPAEFGCLCNLRKTTAQKLAIWALIAIEYIGRIFIPVVFRDKIVERYGDNNLTL